LIELGNTTEQKKINGHARGGNFSLRDYAAPWAVQWLDPDVLGIEEGIWLAHLDFQITHNLKKREKITQINSVNEKQ
jgi:hypothetical protein